MKHSRFKIKGKGIKKIIDKLKDLIKSSGRQEIFAYISKDKKTYSFISERYSFLQNSDMTLTFFIDFQTTNECTIDFLTAGGKIGIFSLDIFSREYSTLEELEENLKEICSNSKWKMETLPEENPRTVIMAPDHL